MDTPSLRDLPIADQERHLVAAAQRALPSFGLDGAHVELLSQDFNATFRVVHPDGVLAMRLNIASSRSAAAVAGELAWVEALAADGVNVPLPRRGHPDVVPTVPVAGVDDPAPVVVFDWLDGDDLGTLVDDDPQRAAPWLRGLGRVMGRLHEHGRDWTLPARTVRPVYATVLLDGEHGLSSADGAWRTPALDAALSATWRSIEALTPSVLAEDHQLVHADLHVWNAKLTRAGTTPVVFDFDDAGYANPLLDLAIATFYLRDDPALEAALHEGLSSSSPVGAALVDQVGTPVFEALVAGRQWLLLDDVVCNPIGPPPGFDVAAYGHKVTGRLEHWLETGRFTLAP